MLELKNNVPLEELRKIPGGLSNEDSSSDSNREFSCLMNLENILKLEDFSKPTNFQRLKQRVAQLEKMKTSLELEKAPLVEKMMELDHFLTLFKNTEQMNPQIPLTRPEIIAQKNELIKKITPIKNKIKKLASPYETLKNLEFKTEESLTFLRHLALEEEKQKIFIAQNKEIIKLKKESDFEAVERKKEVIKAMKPDRKELQLLFQCATIFDKLSNRGLGFEINEKRIIENLKNYLLSQ